MVIILTYRSVRYLLAKHLAPVLNRRISILETGEG